MPTQAFTPLSSPIRPSLSIHPRRRLQTFLPTISGIYFRNCHHFRCEKCEGPLQPFLMVLVHCFLTKHNIFPLMSETCAVSSVTIRPYSSVCPSIHLSIHPFIRPHLSFLLSLQSSTHQSIYLSSAVLHCVSAHPSLIHVSILPFVRGGFVVI